ncbi:hypothetical protein HMI48_00940 [Acidithiobacillus ferrooxidans]|uniref:hypothetical protein n=1 Tax=Acidithiobacillus ferrooxidans TaxID=920 RepID=UPI001C06D623|nr:hypothetical protein [Acidithiobacillus ferrooxidans]MBU2772528.1 hypothetical protein [Acidithiobacillus ferrooxidans]
MNQKYTVILTGITDQPVAQIFCCDQADDEAHAREQAENAYPGCLVNTVFKPEDAGWLQIYSPNESATSSGAGFWSDEDGWVEEGGETLYDVKDCMEKRLPLSLGRDATWQFVHACAASQVAVARRIKSDYLAGNCQASDVDVAVETLMEKCPSLFATRDHAWSFLMEEAHENLEDDGQECNFHVGDEVRWTDPDNNECSGCYTVKAIKSATVVELSSGDCSFEAYFHELS